MGLLETDWTQMQKLEKDEAESTGKGISQKMGSEAGQGQEVQKQYIDTLNDHNFTETCSHVIMCVCTVQVSKCKTGSK